MNTPGDRPRVLVVMPLAHQLGGGEMMFRHLLQHAPRDLVEWIVVFTQEGPMVAEARSLGYEVHVVPAGRMRELPRRVRASRAIARLAHERDVRLIFGWMVAAQLLSGVAALLTRPRIPSAWYQVGRPRPDWLDRLATRLPTRAVLVLSRDAAAAQDRVPPRRPQRLVYPGASLERFEAVREESPQALRERFALPPGPLVGIVGRLQRWKGIHHVVDAMAIVCRAHPGAHLVIVGGAHQTEPAYGDELRARVRAAGLDASVTFAGFQDDVPRWMQAMDVIVHAAEREPFGIVVVEAMALGKPVVAGAAGGPAEVITPGHDGLLAPHGDAPAIAAAIARYLGDPGFAHRCGEAARLRAQDFSARRFALDATRAIREIALQGGDT
jgi:glycosyltransferase involved in cell wall biosynthesis